jgi:dihydrofolate reductase
MSALVVIEYVSVDGVIQAPGHGGEDRSGGFEHGGWTGPYMDEHARLLRDVFRAAGGLLLGRLTYDIWAPYWPTVTDPADEIAAALNALPKYVASRTLEAGTWSPTTVIRDVATEVPALKEGRGGDIVVMGSSELAQALIEHDLVDRYVLWVHPVVLGAGKRLFREGAPHRTLRPLDTTTTAGGLTLLSYAR